jgi:hypothetical protein
MSESLIILKYLLERAGEEVERLLDDKPNDRLEEVSVAINDSLINLIKEMERCSDA